MGQKYQVYTPVKRKPRPEFLLEFKAFRQIYEYTEINLRLYQS